MDRDYNQTMDDLGEIAEEELVVTTAGVLLEREEEHQWDPAETETESIEVYAARVQIDGKVHGVINYECMETALDRAAELVCESDEDAMVSIRHIEALKATVGELGFDRAIALMERLNS
jgi:hypothetical protein